MKIGQDVRIDDFTRFTRPELVEVGKHVAIDWGFYCTTQLEIGDYVHISAHVTCIGGRYGKFLLKGFNNVMAGARIICGTDVFDGSGVHGVLFSDTVRGKVVTGTVVMEEFSNIGTNAIVMPTAILRRGVLLTASSLLMSDTEEWGVYTGNPACLVRKIDGSKIMEKAKKLGYEERF